MSLHPSEHDALLALEVGERAIARGTVLRAEEGPARELYVVLSGWLFSSILLDDGNRQILCLHMAGDLAGDAALPWPATPFTLTAASDARVCAVEKTALIELFDRHPRLGLMLLLVAQAERVALADRLASVGRTDAKSRVAALLVDAFRRLRATGADIARGFVLPLTQEEIGDATGLTAVHVNRMIRRLTDEGLIARENGRLLVLDETRLAAAGNHVDRFGAIDTSWLPPPRA